MSILNAWRSEHRALVGVDTCGLRLAGPEVMTQYDVSKMLLLPHANVVFAARGSQRLLAAVFDLCSEQPNFDVIESHLKDITGIAVDLTTRLARNAGLTNPPPDLFNIEFIVCGWSEQRRSMTIVLCRQSAEAPAVLEPVDDCVLAPWDIEDLGEYIFPNSIDTMMSVARTQAAFLQRKALPNVAFGGRFLIAELWSDGCQIRQAGVL